MRQWAGCYALGVVIELNFWSKLCEKNHENTQHIHSNIHTIPCKWLGATGQMLPNRAPNKNTTITFWTNAQFEQFSLTGTTIQENKEKNKEADNLIDEEIEFLNRVLFKKVDKLN